MKDREKQSQLPTRGGGGGAERKPVIWEPTSWAPAWLVISMTSAACRQRRSLADFLQGEARPGPTLALPALGLCSLLLYSRSLRAQPSGRLPQAFV